MYGDDNRIVATDSTFQTLTMDDSNVNYPDVCMRHTNGTISCGKSRIPELVQNTLIDFDISRSWFCGVTTEGQAICSDHNNNAHTYLPWNEIDANAPYSKIAIWTPSTNNSNKKTNLCTVDTNHRLRCWETGGDYGTAYVVPAVDNLTATQFTDVGLGQSFGCGLDVDQKIICFGYSDFQQTNAPTESAPYTSLTVGACKSCAIDANDKMVCWGYGGGGVASEESYKVVSTSNSGVCSSSFTWAIDINDEITMWGLPSPPTTSGPYKDVATGGNDACAITTGGAIECWGMTEDPPTSTNFSSVYGNQTNYNSTQACALTTSGQLACWGSLFIPVF
jgi:hypothetical protein